MLILLLSGWWIKLHAEQSAEAHICTTMAFKFLYVITKSRPS